jgi:hypothetical protein
MGENAADGVHFRLWPFRHGEPTALVPQASRVIAARLVGHEAGVARRSAVLPTTDRPGNLALWEVANDATSGMLPRHVPCAPLAGLSGVRGCG